MISCHCWVLEASSMVNKYWAYQESLDSVNDSTRLAFCSLGRHVIQRLLISGKYFLWIKTWGSRARHGHIEVRLKVLINGEKSLLLRPGWVLQLLTSDSQCFIFTQYELMAPIGSWEYAFSYDGVGLVWGWWKSVYSAPEWLKRDASRRKKLTKGRCHKAFCSSSSSIWLYNI